MNNQKAPPNKSMVNRGMLLRPVAANMASSGPGPAVGLDGPVAVLPCISLLLLDSTKEGFSECGALLGAPVPVIGEPLCP